MTEPGLKDAQLLDEILGTLIDGQQERDNLARSLNISPEKLLSLCDKVNHVMPVTINSTLNREGVNMLAIRPGCPKILQTFLSTGGFKMMYENKELDCDNEPTNVEGKAEVGIATLNGEEPVTSNKTITFTLVVIGAIATIAIIYVMRHFLSSK
jgi:hypothetical protein